MRCTMHKIIRLVSLLILVLPAACSTLDTFPMIDDTGSATADSRKERSAADSALLYYAYARNLSPTEWARENELSKEAVARNPSDMHRLRQVLLLLAPVAPPREHARAPALLEKLDKELQKSSPRLQPLITLLRSELDERRRLEEKLRDEAKKNEELEQKLEAGKAIEKDLQQKLDALKAIEKNLLDRRRPPPPVSKP